METRGKKKGLISSSLALVLLCSLILIINSKLVTAGAQDPDFYYYYGARKMELTLSTEKLAVRFNQGLTIEEQKAVVESEPGLGLFSQREECPYFREVILPLRKGLTEKNTIEMLKTLNARPEIEGAFPIFVFARSEIISTDEFIVKFGPNVSKAEIDAFNVLNGVEIEDKIEGIELYILRVKDPKNMNTLKMANLYDENPITIFSVFNYIVRTKDMPSSVTPDDKYFEEDEQWPLHNTGQDPPAGSYDADIDAPEGWSISTGSSDIIIAVLDTGVDLAHEDLVNKLVQGYNAYDDNDDPRPGAHWANGHGTACAGLAAAETDNGIGIAGVSWDCRLMPIKVAYVDDNGTLNFPFMSFVRGINWAAGHGADVLSCSVAELGINPNPVVQYAIRDAKNNGREGKGCVLVIAAHNYNCPLIFPSAYPEVIAVGATDHDDVRWNICPCSFPKINGCGSNFGPELDVVAPSGWPGQGVIMWTTDISGGGGYNPGDLNQGDEDGHYLKWMSGTSAATPEVAGLAGLILSVNPGLTSNEVQFIIQYTADDQIGDPSEDTEGWDQYYGWGRINTDNALEAVELQPGAWCVARWKFNEGEGTIAYDSASGYDGTLIGDPQWVSGEIGGNALDFDGAGDGVDSYGSYGFGSPLNIYNSDLTISAWVKVRSGGTIVARAKPSYITYRLGVAGGKAYINTYKSGSGHWILYGDEILDLNTWYHIVGVFDRAGDKGYVYIDGIQRADGTMTIDPYSNDATTKIGCRNSVSDSPFNGVIDDVRIYDKALSAEKIEQLYQNQNGLVGWWKFDDGSDGPSQTASDSSGYGKHGQLGSTPDPDENDPAWVDDLDRGWCLDFDGSDYVSLPPIGALVTDNVTISAWIKADNLTEVYYPIVSTYDNDGSDDYGYFLYVKKNPSSEYKPRFYIATGTGIPVESDVSIDTLGWFHIAGTYDGYNLRVYVDGELKNEPASGYTGYYENYDTTYIGYEDDIPGTGAVFFDGKIDDVRVYNNALSKFEIWDAMSGDSSRFRIKNSSDETVAWFDNYGNIFLKGTLTSGGTCDNYPSGSFIIATSTDVAVAYIDNEGNMCIEGRWLEPPYYPIGDVFMIIGSSAPVSHIDSEGNLWYAGKLCQHNPNP